MDKYFLFKREKPEKISHDPINGDDFYFSPRSSDDFIFEKSIDTEADVIKWIKDIHYSYDYMVVRGEKLEFDIYKETTVSVEIRKK